MATKISSNQQHEQSLQMMGAVGRGGVGVGGVPVASSAAAAAATILNNLSQNRSIRRNGGNFAVPSEYNHQSNEYAQTMTQYNNRQHGNMKGYDVQQGGGEDDDDDEEDEDDEQELDEDGDEEDEDEEDDEGEEDDDDVKNYELDEYHHHHQNYHQHHQNDYHHAQQQHRSSSHHQFHHGMQSSGGGGHHQYNNNPITFAPVSMVNSAAKRKRANACLNDPALLGDIIQVNCNSVVAELHKKKFGSGGKGHCIKVVDMTTGKDGEQKTQERWMTPIEFESYCGKGNCRDWKRTIKAGGQPLVAILNAKILVCHAVSCSCAVCNRNDSLVGPIKPFIRYKRRKKDQILAENAFKKFLSLKPPTLFRDNGGSGGGGSVLQNKPSSLPSSLLPPLPPLPQLPLPPSSSQPQSSSTSLVVAQSSSSQQHLNPSPATSQQLNCFDTVTSNNSVAAASSNEIISHSSSTNFCANMTTTTPITNGLRHQQKETSDDLYDFIEQFQEEEDRKWQNLEQFAENLCSQVQTLKKSIISAKQDSERMRRLMVDRLVLTLSMSSPPSSTNNNNNSSSTHTNESQPQAQSQVNKRKLFNANNNNNNNAQTNCEYLEETGENFDETFNANTNGSDLASSSYSSSGDAAAQKRAKLSDVAQ